MPEHKEKHITDSQVHLAQGGIALFPALNSSRATWGSSETTVFLEAELCVFTEIDWTDQTMHSFCNIFYAD